MSPQCLLGLLWKGWTGCPPSTSRQCYFRPFCAALLHSSLAGSWPCHSHAWGFTPLLASSLPKPATFTSKAQGARAI